MIIRELTSDELAACRIKATQKVDKLLSDNPDKTGEEKFKLLHSMFELAADKWDHTGEHFVRTHAGQLDFSPKDDLHIARPAEEVVLLLKGKACFEETMKATLREMNELQGYGEKRLSKVNGTSMIFNACVERLAEGPKTVQKIPSNIVLPQAMAAVYK